MGLKETASSLVIVNLMEEDRQETLGMNQEALLGTLNPPTGVIRPLMILDKAGISDRMRKVQISGELLVKIVMDHRVSWARLQKIMKWTRDLGYLGLLHHRNLNK